MALLVLLLSFFLSFFLERQKAEARKVELKEAHSAAVSALETHNGEIARTKEFITLSKSAITKAKGHIADLTVKQVSANITLLPLVAVVIFLSATDDFFSFLNF